MLYSAVFDTYPYSDTTNTTLRKLIRITIYIYLSIYLFVDIYYLLLKHELEISIRCCAFTRVLTDSAIEIIKSEELYY